MEPDTHSRAMPGFLHSALIMDSGQTVRRVLAPAVRRALAEADGVFVVVSEQTARLLRGELGADAGQVEWGDTSAFHQRLGFAYETFRRFLAAAHVAGRRIHLFAEPDLANEAAEPGAADRAAAYLAYEAICNETYASYGCEVTCLWDARRHSARLIENVRSLHSHEFRAAGREPSPAFADVGQYLAGRNELPLSRPGRVDWDTSLPSLDGLPALRAEVQDWARRHAFAPIAARDVVVAVNEIVTNGLTHGRPPVRVYGWHHRDTLMVQVDDHGGTPLPATAGYRPPAGHWHSGLWLARQLADVLQIHTTDTSTSVRLYFPHRLTHSNPPRADGAPPTVP